MTKQTDTQIKSANKDEEQLFEVISQLINESRRRVRTVVNIAQVYTNYEIGRYIVEHEQAGNYRATYGKQVLQRLSNRLTDRFGRGWSLEQLTLFRKFFQIYSNSVNTVYEIQHKHTPTFTLSWSHYLILMRIKNEEERRFYEIECRKQQWSFRHLQRQYASSLYERLALSKDKATVLRLASEGQKIEKPEDILKNPLTLEFLGLQPQAVYTESKLETAIIDKLQDFLLELGKGFLFEARQKRFTFNEKHFFVDLVTYNRLLQCYVLIDLKVDDLTHQDLGQMQMYVNYFDRYVKRPFEKPTIGILLCHQKDDELVELTLSPDSNIYAAEYALYLPDKKELQQKLKEWTEEAEE